MFQAMADRRCLVLCMSELFLSPLYLARFISQCLFYLIGYIREGFLAVQHALDKAIMLYHDSSAKETLFDGISIFVQRYPYPAHPQDRLFLLTGDFLPLMFILMFAPTVLSIMRFIVWEKESRLKVIPFIF